MVLYIRYLSGSSLLYHTPSRITWLLGSIVKDLSGYRFIQIKSLRVARELKRRGQTNSCRIWLDDGDTAKELNKYYP